MKLLLINVTFSKDKCSGVSPILFRTYKKMKELGHEVYVFAFKDNNYYDETYKYSNYFIDAHPLHTGKNVILNYLNYYLRSIYNFEAQQKLDKLLEEIKPDLVHIHSVWEFSFSILAPIKKRKIPIIYTVHDISLFCPASFFVGTKYCYDCKGLNTFSCTLKKCVRNNIYRSLYFSIKTFVERLLSVHKKIDLFLTVSQPAKDYVVKMGIDENKIIVLNNFLENKVIEKANNENFSDKGYFLYAGGSRKIKGINTLVKAVSILPRDIEFHLVGAVAGKNLDIVKEIIEKNGLTNIKISGHLTKEQMQEEYKNCTAVIMPSECFETFGMITIEAAAFKKPAIVSNIGGLPSVVDNNKTGLVYEVENVKELSECILKYWNNRDLVKEHGQNAYQKLSEKYNEDRYFEKLIKIYASKMVGENDVLF